MDNIKYEDFKNICRMCMLDCCINVTKDAVILDIFYKLTDIPFDSNDELPQQICRKCFNFINAIHAFSMKCKRTHSALMKCLNNYENKQIKQEPEETYEEIHDEITIVEHKIEFVKDELDNDKKPNDVLIEDVIELPVDLLPPASTYIQTENGKESINIINSNDLNKDLYISDIISLRNKEQVTKKSIEKGHRREQITEHVAVPEISNIVQRRRFKCDQCGKAFIQKGNLTVHMRVHSGERPYQCEQCGKAFPESGSLKKHERVHTGERPYKCNLCEKSFTRSSGLKSHMRGHNGERPFKCDQCEKSYTHISSLKHHKYVHTGEKPFKCDLCEKSFIRLDMLKAHKRVHSGEHPFKCDQCGNSFNQPGNLKTHKRLHSRDVK